MSFIEQHPLYQTYSKESDLYYNHIPNSVWPEFESLILKAVGEDDSFQELIVQLSIKIGCGIVQGNPLEKISEIVSSLRKKVKNGDFDVFMDSLSILIYYGDLSVEEINEFLKKHRIGYIAEQSGFSKRIKWEKNDINLSVPHSVKQEKQDIKIVSMTNMSLDENKEQNMKNEIFISHSSSNAKIADMIKEFLVSTGVPNNNIFCSSLPGNDVDSRIDSEVKNHLNKALVIILVLSKEFYKSAYCLNESGVAWFLSDIVTVIPIALPEINYDSMIGFLNSDFKLRKLDNYADISSIYDQVHSKLSLTQEKVAIVNQEINKLINKYNEYLKK